MHEAYCMKCRTKRKIQNGEVTTLKNGRPAFSGNCGICGTRTFAMISKERAAELTPTA